MASRTTRNKLRFQSLSAMQDLKAAEKHLTQLGALANDQSPYIDEHLPTIMVGLATVILVLEKFDEGL